MLPSVLFAIVMTLLRPLTCSVRLPGLALAMAMLATHAAAAPDPFSREFYSKYPAASEIIKREPGKGEPPTRAELANLDEFLDRMKGARDRLQNQCIGSQSSRMVRKFKGQTILVMPDLFAKCEDDANMLTLGGNRSDLVSIPALMGHWNSYWNAQYSPPKGDPADLKAWRDKARSLTRFDDQPWCNGMAGMLIDTLEGRSSTKKPREIFDEYSPTCGSAWKKMFESSVPKPSPVAQSNDRLTREFYPLYPKTTGEWAEAPGKGEPPPKSGIEAFENHLADMRDIRKQFRQDCIGSESGKMVHKQRGVNVLAWPERFESCESHARKLFEPVGSFDSNMATTWNRYWGANYAPPRGDPADEASWKRWKDGLERFSKECEDASWRIIQSGRPGFRESPEQVFKRVEKRCPAGWITLFEPEEATKKKEVEAKKRCKPGTSYAVVDEKSGNGSRQECDESDKFIPPDSAKDGRSQKKDPLADDLAAIQRGEFERPAGTGEFASSTQAMLNARRQAGAGLTAAMENGVRQQPKAGSIGGVEIFGGQTGKLLESALDEHGASMGVGTSKTDSCDVQARMALTQAQTKAGLERTQGMDERQRGCAREQARLRILIDNLDFATRCKAPASEVTSMKGEVSEARGDVQRACSAATTQPSRTAPKCPAGQVWVGFCVDPKVNPFGNPNARP